MRRGRAGRLHAGARQFRWLHLNLADQWTREWIETVAEVPRPLTAMLLSPERHQRAMVEARPGRLLLHDMERDFDRHDAGAPGCCGWCSARG